MLEVVTMIRHPWRGLRCLPKLQSMPHKIKFTNSLLCEARPPWVNVAPQLLGAGGGDRIHQERLHHVPHPVQVQSQVSALQVGPEAQHPRG